MYCGSPRQDENGLASDKSFWRGTLAPDDDGPLVDEITSYRASSSTSGRGQSTSVRLNLHFDYIQGPRILWIWARPATQDLRFSSESTTWPRQILASPLSFEKGSFRTRMHVAKLRRRNALGVRYSDKHAYAGTDEVHA